MTQETPTRESPPGPPGHALFGNAREFYAGRVSFFEKLVREYGDFVRYRLGYDWHYAINDPHVARAMLRDWTRIDNARPDREFQLDESFIAQAGRARVAPRRLVHSVMCPRTVTRGHERMVSTVEAMRSRWQRSNTSLDLVAEMMRLNLELVSSTLFGRPAAEWLGPVIPMLTDLQLLVGTYTESAATVQRLEAVRRPQLFATIEEVIGRSVDSREQPQGRRAPALEIMMRERAAGRMTRRRMVHEIGVLLMTTAPAAVAKVWALVCLARQPEARARLETELDTLPASVAPTEALDRLEYLRLFIKEVLRLFPPQALISRGTDSEWWRDGHGIPAGCGIDVSPYLLHRHPRYWKEPEAFRPERFDPRSSWHHPDQDLAYIPFGVGVRRCIGEGLANRQLEVLVASVASRHRVELGRDWTLAYDISPLGVLHPEPLEVPFVVRPRAT